MPVFHMTTCCGGVVDRLLLVVALSMQVAGWGWWLCCCCHCPGGHPIVDTVGKVMVVAASFTEVISIDIVLC